MVLGSVNIGRTFPVGAPFVSASSAENQGSHTRAAPTWTADVRTRGHKDSLSPPRERARVRGRSMNFNLGRRPHRSRRRSFQEVTRQSTRHGPSRSGRLRRGGRGRRDLPAGLRQRVLQAHGAGAASKSSRSPWTRPAAACRLMAQCNHGSAQGAADLARQNADIGAEVISFALPRQFPLTDERSIRLRACRLRRGRQRRC